MDNSECRHALRAADGTLDSPLLGQISARLAELEKRLDGRLQDFQTALLDYRREVARLSGFLDALAAKYPLLFKAEALARAEAELQHAQNLTAAQLAGAKTARN